MLFSRRTSLATGVHVVVLLATLVIGGCGGQPVGGGGEQPPGQQLPQCSSDADCPEGEVCSADGTCEVSPVVLTITPDVGSTAGGTAVAILASDPLFLSDLVVLFGAATATDVSVVNPYALTATTPPNPAGTVRIMVIGAQGEVGTIPDGFTYTDARLPGVTPLSATAAAPDTGPTSGGTLVTIIGTGLTADTAVLFGGHASNQATLVNELVLTAITPAHAAGTVDVGLLQPNTEMVTLSGAFTYTEVAELDTTLPRVLGATSTSNTTVTVSFNKVMGDSAEVPSNYLIAQPNVVGEAGALMVTGARFLGGDRSAVELITLSQSLVQYDLYVVNVQDMVGNSLAPKERQLDPAMATFWGTGPTGGGIDSDGDGLTDDEEQRGWLVRVLLSSGEVVEREVTSDPFEADTDGDGLDDKQEKRRVCDPRNRDTDTDTVTDSEEVNVHWTSPINQDSDGDHLADPSEISFFKTSPILEDTDGDQLLDAVEIVQLNRDPRVADLPQPRIDIGEMALRLDSRFSYVDTHGTSQTTDESTQTTLAESETQTFTYSDTRVNKHVVEAGFEAGFKIGGSSKGPSGEVSGKITGGYSFAHENTIAFGRQSSETAQRAYQQSLRTSATVDETHAVRRDVVGAEVDVLLTIGNIGDIPFTLTNLEVTAMAQDPRDRRLFVPVATLVPAIVVDAGAPFPEYALGPFVPDHGPFVFKSSSIFPSLVEDLLRSPRGLIFKVANFDIVNEQGRNFAFVSQDVNDRTAGIIIDYGNGTTDRYRVSTHSTFDGQAQARGITMGFALQDVLGLSKNPPDDAISVGLNGCGETWAIGDDVQIEPPICLPVTPGGVIIEPGPNGVLETIPRGDDIRSADNTIVDGGDGCAHTRASRDDVQVVEGDCATGALDGMLILAGPNGVIDTTPSGDDERMAISGYGTEIVGVCDGNTASVIMDGGNGIADTEAAGDDIQDVALGAAVSPGEVIISVGTNGVIDTVPADDDVFQDPGSACDADVDCPGGRCRQTEVITRVKGVKTEPQESRFWVVLTSADISPGTNFDTMPLKAGDVFSLAYVQDKDGDGLFAREEFLYGSSDRNPNTDGCPFDSGCDPADFDFDTVPDFEEVRRGWEIDVEGKSTYVAFPDPVMPDSDIDGLFDDEEQNSATDPTKQDTDDDGISDFDELRGFDILHRDGSVIHQVGPYQSAFIVAGRDGVADTTAAGDDVQYVTPGNPGNVIILAGSNGVIDTIPASDDQLDAARVIVDGGNALSETTAHQYDEQVGDPPVGKAITVTFESYHVGASACDPGEAKGEFSLVFGVLKGADDLVYTGTAEDSILEDETLPLDQVTSFQLEPGEMFSIFANVWELDSTCDASTPHAIIEPGRGGNGTADTAAAGDDVQEVAFGVDVDPGQIIISVGTNGTLETIPGGDDAEIDPGVPCDINLDCGSNGGVCVGSQSTEWGPLPVVLDYASTTSQTVVFTGGPGCFADHQLLAQVDAGLGTAVGPGSVVVRPGANGVLDTSQPGGDDFIATAHLGHFATDPLDRDTDGDGLPDGVEEAFGGNPNDPGDAAFFRDDDRDGIVNGEEQEVGWFIGYTDSSGGLRCRTGSGDFIVVTDPEDPPFDCEIVTSSPWEPDTDGDSLPDLLEKMLRTDPGSRDTDDDGLLDFDELDPQSPWSIDFAVFRDFEDLCFEADRCYFDTEGSRLYGTSLILQDTDDDLRTDPEEIFGSWVIQPCKMVAGETVQDLPREVTSSPTHTDFDLDGVVDGAEMLLLTDPLDADTDDDGKIDNPAVDPMPNGCGEIMVTVKIKSYDIHGVSGQCGVIPGDFKLVFRVNTPTSTVTFTKFKYIWGLHPKIDLDFVATFPLREWEEFSITGTFTERDPLFGNEWWKLEERAEVQWDALEVTSLSNPSQTIYSVGSETNNQCFDNHRFTVEITSVVAP